MAIKGFWRGPIYNGGGGNGGSWSEVNLATGAPGSNVTYNPSTGTLSIPRGATGPAGPKGDPGDRGPAGAQGPAGAVGPEGPQGPAGAAGATGAVGPQGPEGPDGPEGPQGPQGIQGPIGLQGPAGPKGDTGDTGPQGPAGARGSDGTSVTIKGSLANTAALAEITSPAAGDGYVISGNLHVWTGTGTAWENVGQIQGPQGVQGPAGPTGATGPAGPKGDTGNTGAQGPAGPTGATGAAGPKGGTGNTGAQGPAGPTGATGPSGSAGATGPAGPKGDTGDTGPQGPAGAVGATGPVGPKGDKGDKGDPGDTGPQGPQGPAGTAGATDEVARAAASTAQGDVDAQKPWVASLAPDSLNQRSIINRNNWSPKFWTGGDVTNTLQKTLADHAYPITATDGAAYGVTLAPGQHIMSKRMTRKSSRSDVLLRLQVNTTGPGTIQLRLRNFENDGSGGAIDTDTCAIPGSGRQIVYCLVSASQLAFRTWVRPGFLNNHATMSAILEDFDLVEIDDFLPIGWFNPPASPADAQPAIQEAVRISGRMTKPRIDFQFMELAIFRPVENPTYASTWRNGLFETRGVREDYAGGVMDDDGVPRQKGAIREMNDFQLYENIRITNPVGFIPVQVVTANSVYTEGRCLANGFEDAYKSGTVVSTFSQFRNCGVDEFDDYGMRYTATGSGFTAEKVNIRKRLPTTGVATNNADYDRGYCIILNAGDGCVRDSNLFGGEQQIYQQTGGTIELRGNHLWKPPRTFYRRYFGPAGVAIRTGIFVRQTSQIGTFDAARVAVTRDPANWEVVVTPIATIAQADAAEVQIRADEVSAFLKGYGSEWSGNYFDGGTVRATRGDQHKFDDSNYGLIGAMAGVGAVSFFEWQPNNTAAIPPLNIGMTERNFGKRAIFYPRAAGVYTPTVPIKTFESWGGEYRPDPKQFAVTGTEREVAGFSAMGGIVGISLQRNSNTAGEKKIDILAGAGVPESVVTAGIGSQYINDVTGAIYSKKSGTGNTGWVEIGTGGSASIPADVPRTQSAPAATVPTAPYIQPAVVRFDTTDLPVPIGYLQIVDVRRFGAVTLAGFQDAELTTAQLNANTAALQAAADWSFNTGGYVGLPGGRLDINDQIVFRAGFGIGGVGEHHSKVRQRRLPTSDSEAFTSVFVADPTNRAGINTFDRMIVDGGWNLRGWVGATLGNWEYDRTRMTQKGIWFSTRAATESNIGNGAAGGVNPGALYTEIKSDSQNRVRGVKIENIAGHGLYALGRGEMQINGLWTERCGASGLFTAMADSWYDNITCALSGDSGIVMKAGSSNGRWSNIKSWFTGACKTTEGVGAGIESPDAGLYNVSMVNVATQDTWGPGFVINGNHSIMVNNFQIDEAGGGRLTEQGLGYTGGRTFPRSNIRMSGTLRRSYFEGTVTGGARNTQANYPYLIDLAGSSLENCKFQFFGSLTASDPDNVTLAMDLTTGTHSQVAPNPAWSRNKANGVLWVTGLTNAKRFNEVWFGDKLMYGFMTAANLADATHAVNDAVYGPSKVTMANGLPAYKNLEAGGWYITEVTQVLTEAAYTALATAQQNDSGMTYITRTP